MQRSEQGAMGMGMAEGGAGGYSKDGKGGCTVPITAFFRQMILATTASQAVVEIFFPNRLRL